MTHRTSGRRVLPGVVAFLIGAHVVASGQQAPPLQVPGALRSRVTVVPVAVYVTDLTGRPVADLKESDFTILEDGVRQSISSFSTQEFRAVSGRPAATPRLAEAQPPAPSSTAAGRTFLIMLGRGRLDEPSHGLKAIDAFLRTGLGPDDRVGLMAYTRVTDLTVDREPMLRLLDRYRERYKRVEMLLDTWLPASSWNMAGRTFRRTCSATSTRSSTHRGCRACAICR